MFFERSSSKDIMYIENRLIRERLIAKLREHRRQTADGNADEDATINVRLQIVTAGRGATKTQNQNDDNTQGGGALTS